MKKQVKNLRNLKGAIRSIRADARENRPVYWVTIVYLVIGLLMVIFHEPWMDEAWAWLAARDSSPLQLIDLMSYAGSPALWHFLLYPLAQLGFPYESMGILHTLLSATGVFIFLRFSKFSWGFKLLFVFSSLMIFEYLVVARTYNLTFLFLFAIAAFYPKRFTHPIGFAVLVALLANSNVHSLMFAALIGAIYLFDVLKQKELTKRLFPLGIMAVAGAFSLFQSLPNADHYTNNFDPSYSTPAIAARHILGFNSVFDEMTGYYLAPIVIWVIILTFIKTPRAFFFLIGAAGGLSYILIYRTPGGPRHWGLFILALVFAFWISEYEPQKKWGSMKPGILYFLSSPKGRGLGLAILQFAFAISLGNSLAMLNGDLWGRFTNAKAMGEYMNEYVPDKDIAAYNAGRAMAVQPYLDEKDFWWIQFGYWGTFQTESSDYGPNAYLSKEELIRRVDEGFPDVRPLLLLTVPFQSSEEFGYRLMHAEAEKVTGWNQEYYFLYEPI